MVHLDLCLLYLQLDQMALLVQKDLKLYSDYLVGLKDRKDLFLPYLQ
jgi:hypothetical protein